MSKTRRVALIIDLSVAWRHHHDIYNGIQRYAQDHANWDCVVRPFLGAVESGRGKDVFHGIIARATSELARQAARARVPLVNVWSASPVAGLPSVLPDFAACGRMAAEHLLHRGLRQFCFQGLVKHGGTALAVAAFKSTLRAAKCRCTTQLVTTRFDESARNWASYTTRTEALIGQWKPPVGVFAIHDMLCRHLATACLHAGWRIPEDAAIIGLGNESVVCAQPEPSLSSIDENYEQVGYQAAALLDRLMQGRRPPKAPVFVEPKELVVRRSTDIHVVDHPQVAAALRYISASGDQSVRVVDVARHVHATVRSLERHFQAALGRTMSEEIGRLRLERAKRLLVESDEPIKVLARDCGFNRSSYFGHVFRDAEGVTPGEFRRRRRAKS